MVPAQLKSNWNKIVEQIPFQVDKIVLFRPLHNLWNKTLKRFGSRRSPYAKLHVWNMSETGEPFHGCFSVFGLVLYLKCTTTEIKHCLTPQFYFSFISIVRAPLGINYRL